MLSRIELLPKPNHKGFKAQSGNILPCGCAWGVTKIDCEIPIDTIHIYLVSMYRVRRWDGGFQKVPKGITFHYIAFCIASHLALTHIQNKQCFPYELYGPLCSGTIFKLFFRLNWWVIPGYNDSRSRKFRAPTCEMYFDHVNFYIKELIVVIHAIHVIRYENQKLRYVILHITYTCVR